jgi:hypothetical protein
LTFVLLIPGHYQAVSLVFYRDLRRYYEIVALARSEWIRPIFRFLTCGWFLGLSSSRRGDPSPDASRSAFLPVLDLFTSHAFLSVFSQTVYNPYFTLARINDQVDNRNVSLKSGDPFEIKVPHAGAAASGA